MLPFSTYYLANIEIVCPNACIKIVSNKAMGASKASKDSWDRTRDFPLYREAVG